MTDVPKADLHVHAEADARIDRVLARRDGTKPYDWAAWVKRIQLVPPGMARLNRWLIDRCRPVADVDRLDNDPELYVERICDLMIDEASCGCVLSEILFGARTVVRDDFITGFRKAEQQVQREFPHYHAEPLVSIRHTTDLKLWSRVLDFSQDGLAGISIIPDPYETEADWRCLNRWAERAAMADLGITAHAGEFSAANLRAAIDLPGLTRLGHVTHGFDDLIGLLLEKDIAVECCLTSNTVLGAVENLEAHPIREYAENGVAVVLGSDDPVRVCTTIDREYHIAFSLGFSSRDLHEITLTAIRRSFAPMERRRQIESLVSEWPSARMGSRG